MPPAEHNLTSEQRLQQELDNFSQNIDVHALPDIFHYWSNRYLRPMIEEFGISHPDDLFVMYMFKSAERCEMDAPHFVSVGAGNCDTEIRVAQQLKEKGLKNFTIECIELNPAMLERGRDLAATEGVIDHIAFIQQDFNEWKAEKEYVAIMANQSLHHVQNLEGLLGEIRSSLHPKGAFITSDMIGRNGHQRWPEALSAVHGFWAELPETQKFNHQLQRYEDMYENWDCSSEGFEGIRAQDILPLLVDNFHFELFIAFSNVVDVFIDRGFGHNFDEKNQGDIQFIDRVHAYDEEAISNGSLKPTHLMAVMRKSPVANPKYSRGLTPEFCIRKPDEARADHVLPNDVEPSLVSRLLSWIK